VLSGSAEPEGIYAEEDRFSSTNVEFMGISVRVIGVRRVLRFVATPKPSLVLMDGMLALGGVGV
jgi:hypothetical protein